METLGQLASSGVGAPEGGEEASGNSGSRQEGEFAKIRNLLIISFCLRSLRGAQAKSFKEVRPQWPSRG